jgi:hypothetical protein
MTICRTVEDAFQAGLNAPCEHNIPNPVDCPDCRLTPAEIEHLVVMHRPFLKPVTGRPAASAVA